MSDLDGFKKLVVPKDAYYEADELVDADWLVAEAIELDGQIEGRQEDTFVVEATPFHYKIKYERAPDRVTTEHYFENNARIHVKAEWVGTRHGDYMVYELADYDYRIN